MGMLVEINKLLARFAPEQRILIRTNTTTRYFRAPPILQIFTGLFFACFICWTVIATSALLIAQVSSNDVDAKMDVLQNAYEERILELSNERDLRAQEAARAQERFYVALEQISIQQSELLEAEEQQRELSRGIKIMQQKLQQAIKDRDIVQTHADKLIEELQATTGSLMMREDIVAGTNKVLEEVTQTLVQTASERDILSKEHSELREDYKNLQFESAVLKERGDQIFTRLEEAASLTLEPLKKSLNRKGVDTEGLIATIKKGYSGTGGPVMPLTFGHADQLKDPFASRASDLLSELDRVNLMQIAIEKLPLLLPIDGRYRLTSSYGYRFDPISGGRRMHQGTDMAGRLGTPIIAAGDGVVSRVGWMSGYGKTVKIKHAHGFETLYAHLNRIRVKKGETVSQGQLIGDMGTTGKSTGVHLHYEVRKNGRAVNPAEYIGVANNVY